MKVIRATAAVAFFVALTAVSVSAQDAPGAGTGTNRVPPYPRADRANLSGRERSDSKVA